MGGSITVNSEEGMGSRFVAILDQKIIDNTPIGVVTSLRDSSSYKLASDKVLYKNDLSLKKILIVDDNNLNLKVQANLIKKYYKVKEENIITAKSGRECIRIVKSQEKIDLILMDDMMPELSGIETFDILKTISDFSIPSVMLTANAIDGAKEKYLKEGFVYYLSKPIIPAELNLAIEKVFGKK